LVLRTGLSGNPRFRELLPRVRQVALAAYAHQDLPFEKLVEELQPQRSLNRTPLFRVMFILQDTPLVPLELRNVTLDMEEIDTKTSKFDLLLSVMETEGGIMASLQYDTDLFAAGTIKRMLAHYRVLLESIIAQPDRRISELPLLTELERQRQVEQWNNTGVDYPQDKCIHQLFEARTEQTPGAAAVVFENACLTYRELNHRANRLARYLCQHGVGPETAVGILMERSLEMVVGLLGILKAGGAYVPLDPGYPGEGLQFILEDARVPVVLTQERWAKELPGHRTHVICLDTDGENIAQQSKENPDINLALENSIYITYPAGKRILVTQKGMLGRLQRQQETFPLSGSDVLLYHTSLLVNIAVPEIFWSLLYGGCLAAVNEDKQNYPAYLLDRLVRHQISVAWFFPSTLYSLVISINHGTMPLKALRWVFCSGEPLPGKVVNAFFKHIHCDLYYLYGFPGVPAEITLKKCEPGEIWDTLPIGFPYQVAVYILDKHLHPVPQGAVGEIYIAADGVACFSMKDPQEAALRFLPNPFTGRDGDRLFKTGDSGYYTNNGNIKLIPSPSRAEIAGFPVELEEIETALLSLPLIDECTVMVRESETFTRELVAYVVSSMPLSSGRLQANLRTILPARLVPSVYVHLSALPLTASGDIDKNFLSHLEVIDDNLVRRWEKRIGSLSKVSQAAVVVREQVKHTPPLHLSEVFPDWGTKEVNEIDEQTEYRAEQQDGETCTMAFSDGGPLIIGADAPKTLTAALVRTAFTHKNKGIIYIDNDGSETFLAYESLLTNARCMLSGLKQAHLNPGDKVILQIEMLPDYFTVFWACILGGIVPVTVAIADSYEEKNSVVNKLYHIWELLEHPPVVAGDDITGAVSKMKQFLPMQDLEVLSVGELRSDTVSENFHQSQPGDIAFFQLTSGSTGAPKCIQEAHHCIISHIHGSKQFNGYTPEDVSLNWLPVDHVVPLLTYHIKDVYSGCQQIHVNTAAILADPLKWLDLLEKYNVTHSWSPNFGFKLISEYLTRSPEKKWDLCSVKFFMNAGEQVTLPIISEFLRLVSPFNAAPQTMQPAFGMAEVCTCMTYQNHFNFERGIHRFERSSLSGKLKKTGNDSTDTVTFVDLGPPIPGVQIRIVDKKNQLLPEGVIGRLQIKGDVVTPGYFNNPAANRDAFVGNGWFDSGDLGFILDKRLVLTGRGKDIIIINGVNYCCYEIEDVVKEIPDVEPLHVGACAVHDPSTGSEGLAIFFAPLTDHIDEKIKLIKTIRNRVTEKMGINPNDVVPVEKKDFPRTTSGKIQRSQLKKMLETGYFKKILKEIDLRLENNHTLPAWFYRKTWRAKKPVTIHKQALSGQYLVFLDPMGLGTCLIEELQRLNQPCVSVEMGAKFTKLSENHFCIDPQCPQHYRQLLNSLSKSNFQVNQVLHLWTYDQFTASIDNREDLEQSQYRGVYSLLYLSKALMQENTQQHPVRLYVISNYSQPIPPYNKIAYEKSTVIGLIKTIPREIPWLSPFHVDLTNDKTTVNAARIVGEIQIVDKDDEVAYRNGKRLVARLEKIDLRQEENRGIPIKHGGMYLVSGGLGGIGVEIARYLLKHYQLRLLLIGRTGLPGISTPSTSKENNPVTREKIKAYRTLEKIGGEIMYEAVDILDSDRLKQVVNRAKSLWKCPLDGIIHLAGSLQEGSLAEESHASFVDKICTKVFGTWSLAQLLQHQPGTLFISFSSVNSYFGGAMTGAYTASNCFLDCFSFYQRYKRSLRSYCFNWSKWDNVGMNLSYGSKDILRAGGFQEISISQGIHSFLAGLSYDQEQLFIGLNGHNSHLRRHIVQQSYPIRKLSAYFVSQEGSGAVAKLHEAEVGDRFGTQSTCEFIQIPEMPLTANGEVDRAALSRFVSLKPGARVPYIKPGNKCEKILAAIWQEVLRIDRIGINDHFFELGGHSIQATQVHLKIREVFNRDLTVLDLFKYPTIRSLARYLEKEPKQESSFRASLNRAKTRTRLTGQQRKRRQLHRESKG
ncbi:MAG: SDR family NAD(P)-dependent oxidoreductase, partial [Candidatus Aminicenantes bacterium]